MAEPGSLVHASAVLIGRSAVLIRGGPASGKSRLTIELLQASRAGLLPPAWLVADDRVRIFPAGGRLLAQAPTAIRGLIEMRGLGIRRLDWEPLALISLVVDLGATDAARLPEAESLRTELMGVTLSRLPIAPGESPLPLVLAAFPAPSAS